MGRYVAKQLVIATQVGRVQALVSRGVGQDLPEDVVKQAAVWLFPRRGCYCLLQVLGRASSRVVWRHTGLVSHEESNWW